MPATLNEFVEVTAKMPCPKCGKSDWCLISLDGRKCVCNRVKRGGKRWGKSTGRLHYISGETKPVESLAQTRTSLGPAQVKQYLYLCNRDRPQSMLEHHAHKLGVTYKALRAFRCTYDGELAALVAPMFNGKREPVGCRMRRVDGRKFSLKGGKEGIFIPLDFKSWRPVVIAEGLSDAAAVYDVLNKNVLGRPNCSGGTDEITAVLKGSLTPVVILADPDDPGIDGAQELAVALPNPTIVLTLAEKETDFRDYVSLPNLKGKVKRVIIDTLKGVDDLGFQIVFRNQRGACYDFGKVFK